VTCNHDWCELVPNGKLTSDCRVRAASVLEGEASGGLTVHRNELLSALYSAHLSSPALGGSTGGQQRTASTGVSSSHEWSAHWKPADGEEDLKLASTAV
jgi:hypothetical protein